MFYKHKNEIRKCSRGKCIKAQNEKSCKNLTKVNKSKKIKGNGKSNYRQQHQKQGNAALNPSAENNVDC